MDRMSLSLDEILASRQKETKKQGNKKPQHQPAKAAKQTKTVIKQPFDVNVKKTQGVRVNKPVVTVATTSIFDRLGNNSKNQSHGTAVLISNLNTDITAGEIAELCGRNGEIKKVEIKYNGSGKSLGSAEVVFAKQTDATECVKQLHGVALDGKPMDVKIVMNGKTHPINTVLRNGGEGNVRLGLFGSAMDEEEEVAAGSTGYRVKLVQPFEDNHAHKGHQQQKVRYSQHDRRDSNSHSHNSGRGGRGNGNPRGKKPSGGDRGAKTVEDLDAEMDSYMANK